MDRKIVHTPQAPAAVGTYSQAIISGGLVYTSGQIPIDPGTGKLIEGSFSGRVDQVLKNLNAILVSAGSDLTCAIKLTVYLTDLENFSTLNEVFLKRFAGMDPPARSTVQVSALPLGTDVEIDCIASTPK